MVLVFGLRKALPRHGQPVSIRRSRSWIRFQHHHLTREHFSALNNPEDASAPVQFGKAKPDPANWGVWSYSNVVTSNQLNVDVLFGADYYFNDAIYVGFEAGLRFSNTAGITSTISTTDDNAFNIYFDGGSGSRWRRRTRGEHLVRRQLPVEQRHTLLSTSSTVSLGCPTSSLSTKRLTPCGTIGTSSLLPTRISLVKAATPSSTVQTSWAHTPRACSVLDSCSTKNNPLRLLQKGALVAPFFVSWGHALCV